MKDSPATTTRAESKALNRRLLLDVALAILDEEGESGLTTTAITRRAGMAQSSFYSHFADMDDLLVQLIDERFAEHARARGKVPRRPRDQPLDAEAFRQSVRNGIEVNAAHPALFKLMLRSRLDRSSRTGERSRKWLADAWAATRHDLIARGVPASTEAEKEQVALLAEGFTALVRSFTLGYIDGRHTDLEQILDVVVLFAQGTIDLSRQHRDEAGPPR
jgi:TetR/AcrR family transcriptional regulator, fatty acid biosynthesis regulator